MEKSPDDQLTLCTCYLSGEYLDKLKAVDPLISFLKTTTLCFNQIGVETTEKELREEGITIKWIKEDGQFVGLYLGRLTYDEPDDYVEGNFEPIPKEEDEANNAPTKSNK